jgi:hypothetical protein
MTFPRYDYLTPTDSRLDTESMKLVALIRSIDFVLQIATQIKNYWLTLMNGIALFNEQQSNSDFLLLA